MLPIESNHHLALAISVGLQKSATYRRGCLTHFDALARKHNYPLLGMWRLCIAQRIAVPRNGNVRFGTVLYSRRAVDLKVPMAGFKTVNSSYGAQAQ